MPDLQELMNSRQAAEYINERLSRPWSDPVGSLGNAVYWGLIAPEPVPGADDLKRVPVRFYSQKECDRFIEEHNSPGNQPVDLSEVEGRFGRAPDTVLAREAGVSPRTIKRRRESAGISVYRKHVKEPA